MVVIFVVLCNNTKCPFIAQRRDAVHSRCPFVLYVQQHPEPSDDETKCRQWPCTVCSESDHVIGNTRLEIHDWKSAARPAQIPRRLELLAGGLRQREPLRGRSEPPRKVLMTNVRTAVSWQLLEQESMVQLFRRGTNRIKECRPSAHAGSSNVPTQHFLPPSATHPSLLHTVCKDPTS